MECDNMTLDLLMEDLSDIINEYMFDALLEDVSVPQSDDDKKKKQNILVRFWNMFVKIMKFIGNKIREFVKKVAAYIRLKFSNQKCMVNDDCEVSHEIITGVDDNIGKVINLIARSFAFIERKDGTGDVYQYLDDAEDLMENEFFKSEKKTLRKGTVMNFGILSRNLNEIQKNHDKATKQVEKYAAQMERIDPSSSERANVKNNSLMRAQGIIKKYQAYLNRIMNEMIDFMKNKVSVLVKTKSSVVEQ